MSHAPYIMPDGRPLGQFLQETQAEQPRGTRNSKHSTRRARRAEREGGWTHKGVPRVATTAAEGGEGPGDEAGRLGRDRRRRYLNERILREMAGALTASDMEALFQPVPFGEPRKSLFADAMSPDMLRVWDLFRNIDEDKQSQTLQRWEARLKARTRAEPSGQPDGADAPNAATPPQQSGLNALKSWSRVPRRARDAIKRSSPGAVEALEMPILEFMDSERDGDGALELDLSDSYERLLAHGIAGFHGLRSRTTDCGGVLVSVPQARRRGLPGGSPPITCADIAFALAENPAGGLTARALDAQLRRNHLGSDADSNASFALA